MGPNIRFSFHPSILPVEVPSTPYLGSPCGLLAYRVPKSDRVQVSLCGPLRINIGRAYSLICRHTSYVGPPTPKGKKDFSLQKVV